MNINFTLIPLNTIYSRDDQDMNNKNNNMILVSITKILLRTSQQLWAVRVPFRVVSMWMFNTTLGCANGA